MLCSGKEIFMGKQAESPKCMESDSIQNYSKDTQFVSKKKWLKLGELLCIPYTQLDAKDKRKKIRKNGIHGMKLVFLSMFFHPPPKWSPWLTATPNTFYLKIALWKEKVQKKKVKCLFTSKDLEEGGDPLYMKHNENSSTNTHTHTQSGLWGEDFTNSGNISNNGSRK
jgi:hypothetical protein